MKTPARGSPAATATPTDTATDTATDIAAGVAAPSDPLSKARLRLWVRLLRFMRGAEGDLREMLRVDHDTTLPRFDVMAALYRRREGLTMGELSRMLLVSNGNATAVVDRLERDGLARRSGSTTDRRTVFVTLTAEGLAAFDRYAASHETEISRILGGLTEAEIMQMTEMLKKMGAAK